MMKNFVFIYSFKNYNLSYLFILFVGEVKNLLSRGHGSPGTRDVYCALSLDQEEIFRTTTMERTLK